MSFSLSPADAPRPLDYVVAHPFLADVLAGEFPVQPEGKLHTLGRLMTATYQKGEAGHLDIEERSQIGGPGQVEVFRYEPSWMPGAVASTYTRGDSRTLLLPTLTGLRIESAHAVGLHITQNECGLTIIRPGVSSNSETMELGPGLRRQRQTLAELAGEFFAQTYAATHPGR